MHLGEVSGGGALDLGREVCGGLPQASLVRARMYCSSGTRLTIPSRVKPACWIARRKAFACCLSSA